MDNRNQKNTAKMLRAEKMARKPIHACREDDEDVTDDSEANDPDRPFHSSTPVTNANELYPKIPKVPFPDIKYERAPIKGKEDDKTSNFSLIAIIIAVITSLILYFFYTRLNYTQSSQSIVDIIKDKFDKQPPITYRVLNASLVRILRTENPESPEILLLVSSKEVTDRGVQFSRCLASLLHDNFLHIDASNMGTKDDSQKRSVIDSKIKQSFTDDKLNVLLLNNLDELPPDSAMIFHNYCDHENAQFKKSIFVLTISSDEEISLSVNSKRVDKYASDRLREVWQKLPNEELESLLARITVSVMGILPYATVTKC